MIAGATTDHLYAEETARLVAARLPVLVLAFALIFSAAWAFEYVAHPERTTIYAAVFGLELLVCAVAVVLTRMARARRYSVGVVTAASTLMCALIGLYYPLVGGDAELLALALVYLITGVTVFVPLGGWGQLMVALAAAFAYAGAVAFGARTTTSVPITALGLVSIGGLSVAGATLLDRYRHASFQRAEELRAANDALRKANEAKNLFLANVSHELRSPLNVIIGYAQLVLDGSFGPTPEGLRQPLERVMASTKTLVFLISDLLDLSRIEADRLAVHLERVELAPLFEELRTSMLAWLGSKPVRFVLEEADGLAVRADRDRLLQVLVNLLSNAAKFTAEGEIRMVASLAGPANVQIQVSDTGMGIDPEDLPHIFEPFHRAHRAKDFGGVGIGLSLSARLTRTMGGDIRAESQPGRGSRFTLRLPIATS